jgi:hypothetical protein
MRCLLAIEIAQVRIEHRIDIAAIARERGKRLSRRPDRRAGARMHLQG